MDHCAFDMLFSKNVPHLLEKIFFFLDYKSYKMCLQVNIVWNDVLTSPSFQVKGKSVFHRDLLRDVSVLMKAAKKGDKDKARELLSTGMMNVDSGIADFMSRSALAMAAYFGHTDVVQLLISKGADINKKDISGKCPLHWAAEQGHFDTVRLLINLGAQPALTLLAYNGQKTSLQMLLLAGADPNMRDSDGHTALTRAALMSHEDIVRLLLQSNANPNEGDQYDNTPLHAAAREGSKRIAQILIDGGADPNKRNISARTPIYSAICRNRKDMVKLMMDNGADTNISDEFFMTPILYARSFGYSDIANILYRGPRLL